LTQGKEALCGVLKNTRQRNPSSSVKNKILDKELLCRVFSFTEGFLHSAKSFFAECPKKHLTKILALDEELNSSSDYGSSGSYYRY
jgi:hypothetical protein